MTEPTQKPTVNNDMFEESTTIQPKMTENPFIYFTDEHKFLPPLLGKEIMKLYHFWTPIDEDALYVYNPKKGIYEFNGEAIVKAEADRALGVSSKTHRRNEVVEGVKIASYHKKHNNPKNILALKNGLFDTTNMELDSFTPDKFIINSLPIKYDPNVKCPKFLKFLSEVATPQDILSIQEFFGDCLQLTYRYQKVILLLGEGANGKSTLLKVLGAMLGKENVASIPLQNLDKNRFASSNLYGKLANIYSDLPDLALKQTGQFKMLTGGDLITAERKFKNPFGFENHAKLIYSTNKIPESRDGTIAFYRRWIIINFNNIFEGENDDKHLFEKLTTSEELSGIFNWSLEGLKRLRRQNGYSYKLSTAEIKDLYERKSSSVAGFAKDCLIEDPMGSRLKSEIFILYVDYCKGHKRPPKASNIFAKDLPKWITAESGRESIGEGGRQVSVWKGINVKEEIKEE